MLVVGIAAGYCMATSSAVHAQQAVVCVNCSTLEEDLKDMAQQVLMYAEEAQTQINTLMAYNNLIQNTVSLPVSLYHDITSKVQQITGFVKQAELTNGYSGDMLSSLSAGTYALDKVANFPTLVANENKAVGNALTKAGNALAALPDQLDASSSSLAAIHEQAFGSDSRNAILQAHTGVSAANGQVSAADAAARASGMQALLTINAANMEKDSYIVSLTDAHQKAGIKAACDQVLSITVPACQ
jgi:P-type conjugative transfer protein TrbJ